jgi:DNA modification methylase
VDYCRIVIADDLQPLARPIDTLHLLDGNPRRGDVEAVARSYQRFGQRKPIVARRDGTVIAGNHQLLAARSLGWSEIAVVYVDDDDLTASAYALADNRTADLGSYDSEALADLIAEVSIDLDILMATGYTIEDLDRLIADTTDTTDTTTVGTTTEDLPIPTSAPSKTISGDIWLLGPHRLMCGDSRVPTDVDRLLAGSKVNLAFTSPPYASQRTYDETSGFRPIPPDEYVDWFEMVQANVKAHLADDGSWFVNIKEHADAGQRVLYVKDLTIAHVRSWNWKFIDEFVWEKAGVPGKWNNRLKNGWEPVFHFALNNQIKFDPTRVAVESDHAFTYSPNNAKSPSGSGLLGSERANGFISGMALPSNVLRIRTGGGVTEATHSAAFPVAFPEFFVKAYSDPNDHIYDPFMGSGSTLLAAHQQNRMAYGMEISPTYCDIICRRWQQHTGIQPIAESTGQPHNFLPDE